MNAFYEVDIASMTPSGTMPLEGRPSVVKLFEAFPDTFFFGLEKKTTVGGTSYSLKVKFTTHEINMDNAHNEQITDIAYTSINGQHIFISTSLD